MPCHAQCLQCHPQLRRVTCRNPRKRNAPGRPTAADAGRRRGCCRALLQSSAAEAAPRWPQILQVLVSGSANRRFLDRKSLFHTLMVVTYNSRLWSGLMDFGYRPSEISTMLRLEHKMCQATGSTGKEVGGLEQDVLNAEGGGGGSARSGREAFFATQFSKIC